MRLRRSFQQPTPLLREYLDDLLEKEVVGRVKSLNCRVGVSAFQKLLQEREILDLSIPNPIQYDKCHKLSIMQIWTLTPDGAYAISIDLSDAGWNVLVAHHLSPYSGSR